MSFGFSVGDFLAVYQLASKIRKEFVGAPSQFKAITDEVRSLSIVVEDVNVVLSERDLSDKEKVELDSIAHGCRSVLEELEKTLNKYVELGSGPVNVSTKVKRGWKKLKWEPDDIRELRGRIVSNVNFLNAFNNRLTREGVDKLIHHQDNQERRAILDWLSPTDYATQQSDFIGRRQEGTGLWLINSSEFQGWLSPSKQTMFCPGIPGAGKTMITSIVVDYLGTEFNDADVGIAYLYCNYQRQQEQSAEASLSSLLKQLSQEQPSVPVDVKNLHERHATKGTRPSFIDVVKVLQSTAQLYSKVFIIIDALDECHVSSEEREKFLGEVFNLQAQAKVNIFATSRFVPEIMSQFEASITKTIRAEEADVLKYVNGRIPKLLKSRILKYPDLLHAVREEVVKAVDGMFLLAQLHMDSLISKPTPGDIKRALRNLPRGIKGVDVMYDQAMKRINGQEEEYQTLATRVLSWVTHTKRPLTTAELRHACTVEIGTAELDADFIPEIEDIVSACAGLVTVDENSQIIRWIHYTTQEYFERTWTLLIPNAQVDIASVCLTYLSFDIFAAGFCSTEEDFKTRLRQYTLYDYAARNWGYHTRAASLEVEEIVLNFLKSEVKLSASCQAMLANDHYVRTTPTEMRELHVAAYFGLREAIIALFNPEYNPNSKENVGRMALSIAGIDVNSKGGKYGQTALSWAAGEGHEAVVKLLLGADGIDVNSKGGKYGQTALSRAAGEGHEAVVKLLLGADGIDVNSKGEDGQTALSWAAGNRREAVVKLLLGADGIDVNSKDQYGQTALLLAAVGGCEAVVKLLLGTDGIDVNSKSSSGWTALLCAVAGGHEAVVRLLLGVDGINVNSKDQYGSTELSWAARNGREAVVKLLLGADGIDVNSKDDGLTALSWAAGEGHEAVVKLLLGADGIDVNSKDGYGHTALSWAAERGHEAVVKLLLGADGIDVNSKDEVYGQTALSWAAEKGHEVVVKLLQSHNNPFI